MAENVPPGANAKPGGEGPRGLPYYEKLRKDLRDSLTKKRMADRNLVGYKTTSSRNDLSHLAVGKCRGIDLQPRNEVS